MPADVVPLGRPRSSPFVSLISYSHPEHVSGSDKRRQLIDTVLGRSQEFVLFWRISSVRAQHELAVDRGSERMAQREEWPGRIGHRGMSCGLLSHCWLIWTLTSWYISGDDSYDQRPSIEFDSSGTPPETQPLTRAHFQAQKQARGGRGIKRGKTIIAPKDVNLRSTSWRLCDGLDNLRLVCLSSRWQGSAYHAGETDHPEEMESPLVCQSPISWQARCRCPHVGIPDQFERFDPNPFYDSTVPIVYLCPGKLMSLFSQTSLVLPLVTPQSLISGLASMSVA